MGWRFRQSFKVIPGVRLNLSKSGLSCSIGGAPLTLNVGPRGVYGTASLPETGISYKQRFDGSETPRPDSSAFPVASPQSFPSALPAPTPVPGLASFPVSVIPVREVHSASTELLTSESLKEFKQLIQSTYPSMRPSPANLRKRVRKNRGPRNATSHGRTVFCLRSSSRINSHNGKQIPS